MRVGSWQFLVGSLIVVLVLLVSACTPAPPASKPAEKKETIKYGILASLTGAWATQGAQHKNLSEMAIRDINAQGGVNGAMMELVVEDDKSTPEAGVAATEKLITRDKVVAIGGSYSSGVTLAAMKVATRLETPMITWSVANEITDQGSKYIFRPGQKALWYAEAMVKFAKDEIGANTGALVHTDDAYGTSTAKSIKEVAEAQGLKVLADEAYSPQSVDLSPVIIKLKAARPDVVLAVSSVNDSKLLVTQSHQLDFNPKAIIGGGGGFSTLEYIEGAGKDSEYTFSTVDWTPDVKWPGANEIYERYQKEFGRQFNLSSISVAYIIPGIVAEAAKNAGGVADKTKFRDALASVDMKDSMYGPIKFDKNGQNQHSVLVVQVQNGKFVTVWPKQWAPTSFKPVPSWDKR